MVVDVDVGVQGHFQVLPYDLQGRPEAVVFGLNDLVPFAADPMLDLGPVGSVQAYDREWGSADIDLGHVYDSGNFIDALVGNNCWGNTTSSFWNIETSGQIISAGSAGKTTAKMQTAKTFLEAGWDFVGETANGTQDIWWINEGKDYPRLRWQAE